MSEAWTQEQDQIRRNGRFYCYLADGQVTDSLLRDANRGAMTQEAARSVALSDYGDKSDCYYAWRQLQDAGAWVWDTNEMPENDPQRFEIMHAIQQAMGLLARRFTDRDLSLADEAKERA